MPGPSDKLPPAKRSGQADVDAFLAKLRQIPPAVGGQAKGRLVFALDATASREATWDEASHIQAEMFREAQGLGGLEIQLVHYQGFGEFQASPWFREADGLLRRMTGVSCLAGRTQIAKVLAHVLAETKQARVNALVFVGDHLEEDVDRLGHLAGELGLLGVPAFIFHEGGEAIARRAFEEIARLTRGAYCPFDAGSARQLRELLRAVAVYAAGGRKALSDYGSRVGGGALLLTRRLGP